VKLWLDCDTGCDDTFAIVLAGHNELIELIGISTVFGNNTVDITTRNTLQIVEAAGLNHVKVTEKIRKNGKNREKRFYMV